MMRFISEKVIHKMEFDCIHNDRNFLIQRTSWNFFTKFFVNRMGSGR